MNLSNQLGSQYETVASPAKLGVESRVSKGPTARRKVFFLLDSLNIGGTETQAVQLATRLDSARYEVTLGCLRARGPLLEKLAGTPVCVREFYPKGGFDSPHGMYQMFRLAIFLRRGGFRIVHTHDVYANLLGIPAAVIARVPVIISSQRDLSHLPLVPGGRRVWLRRIQSLSTVVLANAEAVRGKSIQEGHLRAEKILVIYNGVDPEVFDRSSRNSDWLAPACWRWQTDCPGWEHDQRSQRSVGTD